MPQYQTSAGPIPNGNAFLVSTPETTGAVDQLFQQEQARKDRAQQQAIQLDQQMAKDMGQIRGVDIPEFTGNYQKYKAIQMDIDNNPKLQRDPNALAQRRLEAQQALAATYGTMQDSKQAKQDQEDLNKAYLAHPEKMQDNFADMHQALQNTPVSKLKNANVNGQPVDLSDTNSFFDMTPRADLAPMMMKAQGKPTNEYDHSDVINPSDKLSTDRTTYKFGADPLTYTTSLINQFHGSKGVEKTAANAWSQVKPEDVAQVAAAYNALPPERLKRIGLSDPTKLSFDNARSDAEKYAILQGMKYAIQAPIGQETKTFKNQEASTEVNQANREKNMKTQFEYSVRRNALSSNNTLARESAFDDITRNRNLVSKDQANDAADTFVANEVKNAQVPENAVSYTTTTGQKLDGYKIAVKPEVTAQLKNAKGIHEVPPSETLYDPKTNSIVGVFKHTDDNGNTKVETKSMPMSQVNLTYRAIINKGHSDKEGGATPAKGKKLINGF